MRRFLLFAARSPRWCVAGVLALATLGAAPRAFGQTKGDESAPVPSAAPTDAEQAPSPVNAAAKTLANTVDTRRITMEARMRDLLGRLGVVAPTTQDAILAFLSQDEEAKREVRDAGRKLLSAVRRDAPPERLRALLDDYQKAIEENRQKRQRAQTALDAQVGYSLDARLQSILWLLGVLGDNPMAFGPNSFGAPNPPAVERARASAQMAGSPLPDASVNGLLPLASYAARTVSASASEIEGVVTNKSGDEERLWLEVRDEGGRLWRLSPGDSLDARAALARQIKGLTLGTRIVARVQVPTPSPVLLAIVPAVPSPPPTLATPTNAASTTP